MASLKGVEKMSKVLIIEDDPMVALINRKYLERIGGMDIYGPLALEEEVLDLLKREEIDLILLDMYLPQKSGLEILKSIRVNQHFIDVIMITAANGGLEVKEAYAYGVIDYLMKPFEFERFQIAIEKHLKRKSWLLEKNVIKQEDIDSGHHHIDASIHLPKGLNKRTLDKIIEFLKEDETKVWTLRELAKKIEISNVTIKKYMDYLEEVEVVHVSLTSGQVGRPEHIYKVN